MRVTFRWYGENDPVRLRQVRETRASRASFRRCTPFRPQRPGRPPACRRCGRRWSTPVWRYVIGRIPGHEDITIGRGERDRYIDVWCRRVESVGGGRRVRRLLQLHGGVRATSFDGPMRPDHGRMIWDETGRPGYGLRDRALGAMYLQGLWEAVSAR